VTAAWIVVIPVKGTAMAKSRLGGVAGPRAALALAMALDTVTAVLATEAVAEVIVVTSAAAGPTFTALGATVVADSGTSLRTAIIAGLATATAAAPATDARNIAIVLGDLPALQPQELDAALAEASRHPLSMVADSATTGTTLIAASFGNSHAPAFGTGSAVAHAARGYVALEIPISSGLRTDVDTGDDLAALASKAPTSLGRHTRAALAAAS